MMKIQLKVKMYEVKNGVAAEAQSIRLTGRGETEPEALDSLRRGVLAWCAGLKTFGKLEETLDYYGLNWTNDADDNRTTLDMVMLAVS